ncbi:MAG: ArsR family transcriptional regulator [Psychromonas sp.]
MKTILAKVQRLQILEILKEDAGYDQNDLMLMTALEAIGAGTSHDNLNSELAWLEEQALITLEKVGTLLVATITRRGLDIASGRARNPGVNRPRPEV